MPGFKHDAREKKWYELCMLSFAFDASNTLLQLVQQDWQLFKKSCMKFILTRLFCTSLSFCDEQFKTHMIWLSHIDYHWHAYKDKRWEYLFPVTDLNSLTFTFSHRRTRRGRTVLRWGRVVLKWHQFSLFEIIKLEKIRWPISDPSVDLKQKFASIDYFASQYIKLLNISPAKIKSF